MRIFINNYATFLYLLTAKNEKDRAIIDKAKISILISINVDPFNMIIRFIRIR